MEGVEEMDDGENVLSCKRDCCCRVTLRRRTSVSALDTDQTGVEVCVPDNTSAHRQSKWVQSRWWMRADSAGRLIQSTGREFPSKFERGEMIEF